MANRLQVTCTSVREYIYSKTKTDTWFRQEVELSEDGIPLLTFTGRSFDFKFEPGKEYYIDFCKVIAPRKSQIGLHGGDSPRC